MPTEPSIASGIVFGSSDFHSDVAAPQHGSSADGATAASGAAARLVEPRGEDGKRSEVPPLSRGFSSEVSGGHADTQGNRRLIKRYSNRKLYDTHASRYVTLTQIAEMVSDGEVVKVIDNKTREDKTEFTFGQVILEQLKSSTPGMVRVKLAEIIRECQRSRPGTRPVLESEPAPPPVSGPPAESGVSWQAHMEDQLERLPAAEAAAWRARLRDLNARLNELQQRAIQAGFGPHGALGSSLE